MLSRCIACCTCILARNSYLTRAYWREMLIFFDSLCPLQLSTMSQSLLDLWKIKSKESNKRKSSSTEENTNSKANKYEETRVRRFQPSWRKEFAWVEFNDEKKEMFCVVCRKHPTVADRESRLFLGINGSSSSGFRRDTLVSHNISRCHVFCVQREKYQARPEEAPLTRISRKIDNESQERLEKLFNTAHFVAKEKIALAKFPGLCDLQEKNGINIGQHYRNAPACKGFISAIAISERNGTKNDLKNSRFFSVLADGSTDSGIIEQESVFVRYVDKGGEVRSTLVDVVDLESGNAEGMCLYLFSRRSQRFWKSLNSSELN